jgi:hypothetical protein
MLEDDPGKNHGKDDVPPPLPKRQTPPAAVRAAPTSPPASVNANNFLDASPYRPEDRYFEQAETFLKEYRENRNAPAVSQFLENCIKQTLPNRLAVLDALFDMLCQNYDPELYETLVPRLSHMMNQILERTYDTH